MSLTEFWSFCKTYKIPTRTLNAKIDLLFVSIDSKYKDAPHNPSRSFTLGEFLEGLVRSILRQSTPMTPEVPLPECLEHLLEHQIFAHSDGTDGVRPVVPTDEFNDGVTTYASDRAVRYRLHKSGVARMLKLHQKQLLKVFRKHAKSSMSATGVHDDTMQYDEWVALMKKAELLDDSLSRVVLILRRAPSTTRRSRRVEERGRLVQGLIFPSSRRRSAAAPSSSTTTSPPTSARCTKSSSCSSRRPPASRAQARAEPRRPARRREAEAAAAKRRGRRHHQGRRLEPADDRRPPARCIAPAGATSSMQGRHRRRRHGRRPRRAGAQAGRLQFRDLVEGK